jgi:predicted  nucleic acid-binding Zn-ribbon protein
MALESLKLLEERINGFIAHHEKVCGEKSELLMRLKEQEQAYAVLMEQVRQYEKERNEVREKLEIIINKFNHLYDLNESEG